MLLYCRSTGTIMALNYKIDGRRRVKIWDGLLSIDNSLSTSYPASCANSVFCEQTQPLYREKINSRSAYRAVYSGSSCFFACTPDPSCTSAQLICSAALPTGCEGAVYPEAATIS